VSASSPYYFPELGDVADGEDLGRALNAVEGGILLADATRPGFPILYANPGFERLTGYSAPEVVGRNCRFLQGPRTNPAAVAAVAQALAAFQPISITLLNYRKDGTSFWNELRLAPVRNADGRPWRVIGMQHDVTDLITSALLAAEAQRAATANAEAAAARAHRAVRALLRVREEADLALEHLADPTPEPTAAQSVAHLSCQPPS
jgi:PAS domain S-box-containing protein